MKKILLSILFGSGLLVGSPLLAQVLLPQYSLWEGFAFGDMQTVESRETEERFARFLLSIANQTLTQQNEQIGALLDKAEQNNVAERFFTLAEKYLYDPNSPYRNDEQYLLFLQYAATHQLADYTTNPRYQKHYAMVQKNRVGHKAMDFAYITQAGEKGRLYNLQSRYILLFFHDPDCEECQYVKQLLESQQKAFAQKGVQVVAIYIDDEVAQWQKVEYPSEWLSVYAPEIDQQDLYNIKAQPTLYLLDEHKRVAVKDGSLGHLIHFFNNK
jgi:cytochrome oxidase Cu insertion factor (SCO1/SenC/PrrC family)